MQEKINQKMEAYQISFGALSEYLGISKQTLTRKMKGTTTWTFKEMLAIGSLFHIEDIQEFFGL